MNRDLFELLPRARLVREDPCLLPAHLRLVLAVVPNRRAVRRIEVVQKDAEVVVESDIVLLSADAARSPVA